MKKLTQKNIKWLKSFLSDVIKRECQAHLYYKFKIDYKITYNTYYNLNKIVIIITNMYKENSILSCYQSFNFSDEILMSYEKHELYDDGSIQQKYISFYDLELVNNVCDNIKEFYKSVGK